MLQKFFATGIALASFAALKAQDSASLSEEPSSPLVSGYVDVFYRHNFANARHVDGGVFNNLTSFTNSQASFELGMASVRLDHSWNKVSVVADLGFGKRAQEFSYNDSNTMLAVKQVYVAYQLTEKLKISAGSWATHVGYELVDPYLNRNYSMSYMFSYGPFFHTGLKAEYTAGKNGFMIGILNPTDLKSANFQQKMIGAQYSYSASDNWKFFANYIGGKAAEDQNLQQIDAVILATITDKFSIGYNGTVQVRKYKDATGKYGDGSRWWGSALYFDVDPSSKAGFTLRAEYMDDKEDVIGLGVGNVFETTLSANFKMGPLTIIPELRMDNADNPIFVKNEGETTNNTFTALLAAVYRF
jgi:hypothetical protein